MPACRNGPVSSNVRLHNTLFLMRRSHSPLAQRTVLVTRMAGAAFATSLLLHNNVVVSNECLKGDLTQKLIGESTEIDSCFKSDRNTCHLEKMSVEMQRELNSQRLIPFDRSQNKLMDRATGVVSATFSGLETEAATGQKISRCHVLTSAHLLYKDTNVSVDLPDLKNGNNNRDIKLRFHVGQSCDKNLFRESTEAVVHFKMTEPNVDFICNKKDSSGHCIERRFYGESDLIILRLLNFERTAEHHFRLFTGQLQTLPKSGLRVNCWGYPEHNHQIKLPKLLADQVLWHQKDAKVFPWPNAKGLPTNAIAYPGMSGGGCVNPDFPDKLVAIFADTNSATGHAAILITENNVDKVPVNFTSPFQKLAVRYRNATGKSIERLDEECN